MGRKIIFEGNEYDLIEWHLTHVVAVDRFGNKLFVKHTQNKNNLFYQFKNIFSLKLLCNSK